MKSKFIRRAAPDTFGVEGLGMAISIRGFQMSSFRGDAAAAALLLAAAAPAAQAQVNEETAEEIRRALKVWVGQNLQSGNSSHTMELDGQISVVPQGGLYRATLPGGRALIPGEGTVHFGETAIDMTPLDNGWYDTTWQFPDSYRIEPNYDSPVLITIGGQSGTGVFAPEFQTLMSMDAELTAITAAEAEGDARLTIDRVTAVGQSTEVSSGVYDQDSTLRLNGIRFTENNGRNSFELSEAAVTVTTDDGRLAELADFQRRSNALTLEIERSHDPEQVSAALGSFADLMETMPILMAGAGMEMRFGTVTVSDYGDEFTMDAGLFSVAMDGLDKDLSEVAIMASSDGMSVNDPEVAKVIPNETRFRLALTDLPNAELVQIGIGTMRSMGTTDPAMAMLMASGGLQQALATADSTVEIGPIRIASATSSIDLEGVLRPDASSPYAVVGEVDMVATGLDTLITQLQTVGGDPEVIQVLTLMQTLGAQAPDADGRTVRTYALRLDNTGKLLLNGADVMPLIGLQ